MRTTSSFGRCCFGVLGAMAMFALMKSDYRQLRVISPLLMLVALLGLVAVLIPGIGVERTAHRAGSRVGGPIPPIQPSEFAKLALIIYVSAWLAAAARDVKSFWTGFVPVRRIRRPRRRA